MVAVKHRGRVEGIPPGRPEGGLHASRDGSSGAGRRLPPIHLHGEAQLPGVHHRVVGHVTVKQAGWPSIVGQEFARACQPRRLVFPDRKARREATLVLRVKPGEATRLAHLEPVLVDRVNGFFGYQAVKRLKLEQGHLVDRTPPPRPRPQPSLDESESQAARARISTIQDDRLREALNRLSDRLSGGAPGGRSDGESRG